MSIYDVPNIETLTFKDYVLRHHIILFENDKYEGILVRQARTTFPWPDHIKDLKDLWDDIYLTSDGIADHEGLCWSARTLWDAYQCTREYHGLPVKWSYEYDDEGYLPPDEEDRTPLDPVFVWSSELQESFTVNHYDDAPGTSRSGAHSFGGNNVS